MFVPRLLTPVPLAGLPEALDAAHRERRGYSLSTDAYRLADAQLRLEHGILLGALRGVFNFNMGNHDATPEERADPAIPLFETVPEHEEDPHGRGYLAQHVRRAYPDLDSGLVGYWDTLLSARYQDAYYALEQGPEAYAAALKTGGYFTASEAAYAGALRELVTPPGR